MRSCLPTKQIAKNGKVTTKNTPDHIYKHKQKDATTKRCVFCQPKNTHRSSTQKRQIRCRKELSTSYIPISFLCLFFIVIVSYILFHVNLQSADTCAQWLNFPLFICLGTLKSTLEYCVFCAKSIYYLTIIWYNIHKLHRSFPANEIQKDKETFTWKRS